MPLGEIVPADSTITECGQGASVPSSIHSDGRGLGQVGGGPAVGAGGPTPCDSQPLSNLSTLFLVSFLFCLTFFSMNKSHVAMFHNSVFECNSSKIHCFKAYGLVVFSIFTRVCNHHHYLVPENFHHPQKKPRQAVTSMTSCL